MSTTTPQLDLTPEQAAALRNRTSLAGRAAINAKKRMTSPWASVVEVILAVVWTIPTFGLLVTSFRPELAIKTTGWWTFFQDPQITLDNYKTVMDAQGSSGLGAYFVNSFVIVIPAVVIPICLAVLAAYAFAWIDFKGRDILFVLVIPIVVYNVRQMRASEAR